MLDSLIELFQWKTINTIKSTTNVSTINTKYHYHVDLP